MGKHDEFLGDVLQDLPPRAAPLQRGTDHLAVGWGSRRYQYLFLRIYSSFRFQEVVRVRPDHRGLQESGWSSVCYPRASLILGWAAPTVSRAVNVRLDYLSAATFAPRCICRIMA